MTVNEMIIRLEQLARKHGNYEIRTFQRGAMWDSPVKSIEVDNHRDKAFNKKYVIISN